jgi:hypothetical protein
MNRRPHDDVLDLPSALSWVRRAWATLPVAPDRIHARDIEDQSVLGSHRFSAAMWRILTSSAYAVHESAETVQCNHNRLTTASVFDCIDCHGNGFYEHRVTRYRWPMRAALASLAKVPRPSEGSPAPIDTILALAHAGWDPVRAAPLLGIEVVSPDHAVTVQAMFLMNLRRLRDRYSEAPISKTGWVDKSDAQRAAEEAA